MVIGAEARAGSSLRTTNRAPLFALGFALALVAFVGVFILGRAAASVGSGSVAVVVATRDIQPREVIDRNALTVTHLSANVAPPGAMTRVTDVAGDSAQIKILRGQAITANAISSAPDQSVGPGPAFLPIPQGSIAFTLPTNEQQGVGGYVAAGDYIDIVATVNTAAFKDPNPKVVTATVFHHVHVIRVGPAVDANRGGQQIGVASSLTVVVTECEAQVMDWLLANSSLRYLLLSYKDYDPTPPAKLNCPASGIVGPPLIDSFFAFTKG
jgi:pilus assembly protein CpaB